jgi:hypothetical protein
VFGPKSRIVSGALVQTDHLITSVASDGCRAYTVRVLVVFELPFPSSLAFTLPVTARDELIIVLAFIGTHVFNRVMTQCVLCIIRFGRGARWNRPIEVELDWTGAQVLIDKEIDRGPVGVIVILNHSWTPTTLYCVGTVRGRLGIVIMLSGGTVHVYLVRGGWGTWSGS